jgi:peroxiredoxin Q/BCP
MTQLTLSTKAPEFKLPNQSGKIKTNEDYAGKWLILYFYPKDNTSGCTKEAVDFTQNKRKISSRSATVAGVSPDSVQKHINFIRKHELKIELLSDETKTTLKKYGVWQLKKWPGANIWVL